MCFIDIYMKEFFLCVIFVVEIIKKTEKKFFCKKKMKFSDSLQNLMQYRGPIGGLWGKKFQLDSKRFGRYRFPGVSQFFDSLTVKEVKFKWVMMLTIDVDRQE